ncbi:DUF4145 domain-containing protein [Candidatus Methylomirabilis sp.]|uniref:DUF4145 domain-containing protein n=1 Tax=Candidatus Methylomirabilis sp. TaxID=2032687 RepID=UPI0030761D06
MDAIVEGTYAAFDEEIGLDFKYTLARCPRCGNPVLFSHAVFPNGTSDETHQMYPAQQQQRVSAAVPPSIAMAFTEALNCFNAKAFTACAIMCRKTLEGICAEHGVNERTLLDSLKQLKDQGVIENRLFEWADALRIVGNEAAHDVTVLVSAQDAKDLTDFTNALLEYTFTFRDKFEQFKKRRARSAQPNSALCLST